MIFRILIFILGFFLVVSIYIFNYFASGLDHLNVKDIYHESRDLAENLFRESRSQDPDDQNPDDKDELV